MVNRMTNEPNILPERVHHRRLFRYELSHTAMATYGRFTPEFSITYRSRGTNGRLLIVKDGDILLLTVPSTSSYYDGGRGVRGYMVGRICLLCHRFGYFS